jgi:hypothetical protein
MNSGRPRTKAQSVFAKWHIISFNVISVNTCHRVVLLQEDSRTVNDHITSFVKGNHHYHHKRQITTALVNSSAPFQEVKLMTIISSTRLPAVRYSIIFWMILPLDSHQQQ